VLQLFATSALRSRVGVAIVLLVVVFGVVGVARAVSGPDDIGTIVPQPQAQPESTVSRIASDDGVVESAPVASPTITLSPGTPAAEDVAAAFASAWLNQKLSAKRWHAALLPHATAELAKKLEGVDEQQFLKTIKEWNAAVMTEVPFNPAVKDGRSTRGLAVPKSNWANTIDEPPFEAYAVTCGLTFTFGGLKITNEGEVESTDGQPIPGLFAAGELVGGLFYHNYPGGTGLVSGAVLGKLAGDSAGRYVVGKN
jgi:hypothetical protein